MIILLALCVIKSNVIFLMKKTDQIKKKILQIM